MNDAFFIEQFEKINQHFGVIDQRFDQIDQRFEQVDQRLKVMDNRFDKMDRRLDGLVRELKDHKHETRVQFAGFNDRLTEIENRQDSQSREIAEVFSFVKLTYYMAIDHEKEFRSLDDKLFDHRSKIANTIDLFVKEFKETRDEQVFLSERVDRIEKKFSAA
jgi:predicted  nucleic acid-binding Zn-ribbon protein